MKLMDKKAYRGTPVTNTSKNPPEGMTIKTCEEYVGLLIFWICTIFLTEDDDL